LPVVRAAAASRWREAAAAREGQERGAGAAPASAPESPVGGARERERTFWFHKFVFQYHGIHFFCLLKIEL